MSEYTDYRLSIRPTGSYSTPLQADTIMGSIAWQVAYREGVEACTKFLDFFLEGNPPFIISDAVPAGLMPKPVFQNAMNPAKDLKEYEHAKNSRKYQFVNEKEFHQFRRGELVEYAPVQKPVDNVDVLHAALSRATETTGDGGNLYSVSTSYLSGSYDRFFIYLRVRQEWAVKAEKYIQNVFTEGYGKDRTTGAGHFEIIGYEPFEGFSTPDGANGFIAVSTFMPSSNDPIEGWWAINTKYGKLGENAGRNNPFKKPVVQFVPGSMFRTKGLPRPWYGRAVKGLAFGMPEAVQLCFCLAVPCIVPKTR